LFFGKGGKEGVGEVGLRGGGTLILDWGMREGSVDCEKAIEDV
jgi:hypothetical protein